MALCLLGTSTFSTAPKRTTLRSHFSPGFNSCVKSMLVVSLNTVSVAVICNHEVFVHRSVCQCLVSLVTFPLVTWLFFDVIDSVHHLFSSCVIRGHKRHQHPPCVSRMVFSPALPSREMSGFEAKIRSRGVSAALNVSLLLHNERR